MEDENTDDENRCPYCRSTDECAHLVAAMDTTFSECQGGYALERLHEFDSLVAEALRPVLQGRRSKKGLWDNPELNELWSGAAGTESDEDIPLDPYIMTRLIIKLFEKAGGKSSRGIDDPSTPGFSSALTLVHAQDPTKVFDDALSKFTRLLESTKQLRKSKRMPYSP